jgi:hypothetical protein
MSLGRLSEYLAISRHEAMNLITGEPCDGRSISLGDLGREYCH